MLNYIWAGLIVFAMLFALTSDVSDLRSHVYANGEPLAVTINYPSATDRDARDTSVDVRIEPADYADHFHLSPTGTEALAASYPATLSRADKGFLVRFAKDTSLPPRLAKMRDFADSKELLATAV